MRRLMFSGAAAAVLALGGCHAATSSSPAGGAQDMPLAITDGRLVLPAVPGNPAAAYFTVTNKGPVDEVLTLASIHDAEKTEMHETVGNTMKSLDGVTIPAGGSVSFKPGGKHLMVFGLSPDDKPDGPGGGTTSLLLRFVDVSQGALHTGQETVRIKIEAAGAAASDDMAGMKM